MTDETAKTFDRSAEIATLAACLQSRIARQAARRHISGADFASPVHELIWDQMSRLDRGGKDADPAALLSLLQAGLASATPTTRQTHASAIELLPTLVTWPAFGEHVATYAETVREWSVRRRLNAEAIRIQQQALNPAIDFTGMAATAAARVTAVRDSGQASEDAESITLGELLAEVDDEPDWVIPGLLERRDRLMLTGVEGLGKSHLLRQIAIMGAAGLDPFDPGKRINPLSVLIIDCENSARLVKRKVRRVVEFASRYGHGRPENVNLLCSSRIDIATDRDLARIHREADACQPDLVVIGPMYRLAPRAIQTDDEAAPILAALDTLRDRGITLLIEAHAGHSIGQHGQRDLRPRGSSALLGWPEFGYGMRNVADGVADFVPWRGDRDQRDWPYRLRRCNQHIRWIPIDESVQLGTEEWA